MGKKVIYISKVNNKMFGKRSFAPALRSKDKYGNHIYIPNVKK